jgi:hypothetical protein
LYIKNFQSYVFKRQGMSIVFDADIYNIEEKGDIIVRIILTV